VRPETQHQIDKIDLAARHEQLAPGEFVQAMRAIRYPLSDAENTKVFEVVSNAAGSGVYNCKKLKLVAENWLGGPVDKFEEDGDPEEIVEVLNLYENCPTEEDQHNLDVEVRLLATKLPIGGVDIIVIARDGSGLVEAAIALNTAFEEGQIITVAGVSDETLNGTFVLTDVFSDAEMTYLGWSQAGAEVEIDDSGTVELFGGSFKWIGIPDTAAGATRTAQIQSVEASSFTCKLWGYTGGSWSLAASTITVSPQIILGSNALSGNVDPKLTAGDTLTVLHELDGTWTAPNLIIDDATTC